MYFEKLFHNCSSNPTIFSIFQSDYQYCAQNQTIRPSIGYYHRWQYLSTANTNTITNTNTNANSGEKEVAAQLKSSDHSGTARPSWSSRQLPRQTGKQNFLSCHQSGFLYLSISDFSTSAKIHLLVLDRGVKGFSEIDNDKSWQNLNWKFWAAQVQTACFIIFSGFWHWSICTHIDTLWHMSVSAHPVYMTRW